MALFCEQDTTTFFNPFLFDWGSLWFNQPTKAPLTSNDTDSDNETVTAEASSPSSTTTHTMTTETDQSTRAQTTSDGIVTTTDKSTRDDSQVEDLRLIAEMCGKGNHTRYLNQEEQEEQAFRCNVLLRSRRARLVNVSAGDAFFVPDVICSPEPDAFNPCEDLMGSWWLRVAVWIVFVFALAMNLFVLLVARLSRKEWRDDNRMDRSIERLLITNLVSADLCLAIFLGFLAAVDALTFGDYAKTAIDWQQGTWCNAAGFLSLFGMQLSVLMLVLVNVERLYSVSYRMTPGVSLENRWTIALIIIFWVYSAIIAAFPMVGFSSYSRVAICLPFEAETAEGHAFLSFLLISNGVFAFIVMMAYCGIIRAALKSQGSGQKERRRLMASIFIIVFVDFSCWLPIAVVGLSALYGNNLISTSSSKIFLVFVYPINCLANPILYAFLLKHFREHIFDFLHTRLHLFNKTYSNRRRRRSMKSLDSDIIAFHKSKSPSHYRASLPSIGAGSENSSMNFIQTEKTPLARHAAMTSTVLANLGALADEVEVDLDEHQLTELQSNNKQAGPKRSDDSDYSSGRSSIEQLSTQISVVELSDHLPVFARLAEQKQKSEACLQHRQNAVSSARRMSAPSLNMPVSAGGWRREEGGSFEVNMEAERHLEEAGKSSQTGSHLANSIAFNSTCDEQSVDSSHGDTDK